MFYIAHILFSFISSAWSNSLLPLSYLAMTILALLRCSIKNLIAPLGLQDKAQTTLLGLRSPIPFGPHHSLQTCLPLSHQNKPPLSSALLPPVCCVPIDSRIFVHRVPLPPPSISGLQIPTWNLPSAITTPTVPTAILTRLHPHMHHPSSSGFSERITHKGTDTDFWMVCPVPSPACENLEVLGCLPRFL